MHFTMSFPRAEGGEGGRGSWKTKREVKVDASKVNKSKIEHLQTELLGNKLSGQSCHHRPFAPTRSWVGYQSCAGGMGREEWEWE